MTNNIDTNDDLIDVRDVIARVEQLRASLSNDPFRGFDRDPADVADERSELATLESLLAELAGNGGDEQWEGSWYPVTLIRDSYFEDYARELAEDIGAVSVVAPWPTYCIDWERAARDLRMDYSSVEFDGVTYWTR
jgi:hypothetical protein